MHHPNHPKDVIMVGRVSTQLRYNSSLGQWILKSEGYRVEAATNASQISYALGKHNWTISGDSDECRKGKLSYTIEMKLTGCKEGEFTCIDGQCVEMSERCNQLADCRDKSDERGCKILHLEEGYNMRVPPISITGGNKKKMKPVPLNISLLLYKVVAIEEEDHSIELQFQITLEWKENRATFHNLKNETYMNALSKKDINRLWLPLIIYTNTDQQETTRLGVDWEWSTKVLVKRESNFERSETEVLDETEIFKGSENSLSMVQSYTHKFQCVYQLEYYPFDTQVRQN